MKKLILVAGFLLPGAALTVPAEELRDALPRITAHFEAVPYQFLKINADISIAYKHFKAKEGLASVVVLPGRTESIEKYMELVWDWRELPFDIFLMDHRGQGRSSRWHSIASTCSVPLGQSDWL